VDLSPDSLAALQDARAAAVKAAAAASCDVGDVHLMPGWWVCRWFPDGKNNRPCVVVGVETAADGTRIAHLVGGTKTRGGPPRLVAEAGEGNLKFKTLFKFSFSGSLPVSRLRTIGKHQGRLDAARLPDIDAANAASPLARLRSLPPTSPTTSTSAASAGSTSTLTPPAAPAPPASAAPAPSSPPSAVATGSTGSGSGNGLQSGSGSDSLTTEKTSGAPAERGTS